MGQVAWWIIPEDLSLSRRAKVFLYLHIALDASETITGD